MSTKVKYVLNPFTGQFDAITPVNISDIIHSILLDKNEQPATGRPYIEILFDEDSILFNDDKAKV